MVTLIEILIDLRKGSLELVNQYWNALNDIAIDLLKDHTVGDDQKLLKDLDTLLRICNILYNDTDFEVLPIEDGLYDLLLEKYKKYDPYFQVGSEMIEFKPMQPALIFMDDELNNVPAIVYDPELQDRIQSGLFMDEIVYPNLRIDENDFIPSNSEVNQEYIKKGRHDTAHNHPELIGTLDKCKFVLCKNAAERGVIDDPKVKILERDFFADHIRKGIIKPDQPLWMVIELKYDGVSVEADCERTVLSARSRGDTGMGQAKDMTQLLAGYNFPHQVDDIDSIGIKFEAIMMRDDLRKFNELRGKNYKNSRSAIVGLSTASDGGMYRDLITLVPLQVEESLYKKLGCDRRNEIEFMNTFFTSHGCPLRYTVIHGTYIELLFQIKIFLEEAEFARNYLPFMYDGIVVSYIDEDIRQKLGRENYINKYSMAVKFNPLKKQSIFRGYKYTVGQDGVITPMIYYDPVEFYGTIHPKSSGHSYARFKELDLAIGDIVDIDYTNDVMTYVSKPVNDHNTYNENPPEKFPTHCPECNSELIESPSGKSIYCLNMNCQGRSLARMVNTFSKLNLAEFGEETIRKLGKTHLLEICQIRCNDGFQKYGFGPGESALLEAEIDKLLNNPIKDYRLFGALGFTNVAEKTWQLIFSQYNVDDLHTDFGYVIYGLANYTEEDYEEAKNKITKKLISIKGLGPVTVSTIMSEWQYFEFDINYCLRYCIGLEPTFGKTMGKQIRATGFRDKELFDHLRSLGFDADDNAGVTNKTDILLIPFDGYDTGSKVKKALGIETCKLISIDDFKSNMDKHLI